MTTNNWGFVCEACGVHVTRIRDPEAAQEAYEEHMGSCTQAITAWLLGELLYWIHSGEKLLLQDVTELAEQAIALRP